MPVRLTSDSESLLLRTPAASEAERGHQPEEKAKARGGQVTLSGQVNYLPTLTTNGTGRNSASYDSLGTLQMLEVSRGELPREYSSWAEINGKVPAEWRDGAAAEEDQTAHLMRTPDAYAGIRGGSQDPDKKKAGNHTVTLSDQIEKGTNYGRFEPAVRRWEAITGNLAPAPTKPDGKHGNPRLSSHFTEWMMGLEPGWITGVGLSRKDELKACGNGVVPQQAKLALTILLDRLGV
jgi:DNA (cytosine-5)-methyltransferase 1